MSDEAATPERVAFKIDGKEVFAKPGQTVLEAARDNGVDIPHYCYHPALSIAGNCRTCLVLSNRAPKPIISCQTPVSEGVEIEFDTPASREVREGVMEFQLINHPLDCPVCDQAGECDLQEYSFHHGRGTSRFDEAKNQKPNKDLGPLVRFNGNRCINCTRCVRFCDEITESSELTQRERGDRAYIDTFPGYPLDNPLSLCTTDLCPVGALLDRDFMHKARVWNLTTTKTVCAGCATGCNVQAQSWNDALQRLVPRENQAVNRFWMCDEGRLLYHATEASESRLSECLARVKGKPEGVLGEQAIETIVAALKASRDAKERVGFLLTGNATNEEAYLALSLCREEQSPKVGAGELPIAVIYASDEPDKAWKATDGFEISADRNANRGGLQRILGEDFAKGAAPGVEALAKKIQSGKVKTLIVLDGLAPDALSLPESLEKALGKLDSLILFTPFDGDDALSKKASLRIPGATWLEKDGTYVNRQGRVQRLRSARMPALGVRWELELLQEVQRRVGDGRGVVSSGGVFRRLAKTPDSPFAGLSLNDLGDFGKLLDGQDESTVDTGYGAGTGSRKLYHDRAVPEMIRVSVHRGG